MTVTNSLTKMTSGNLISADPIVSNFCFVLNKITSVTIEQLKTDSLSLKYTDQTYNVALSSGIDTGNTTAYLFGTNYYCASTGTAEEAVFDDFSAGSIDTIWTQAKDSVVPPWGVTTITQSGGLLDMYCNGFNDGYDGYASVTQNTGTNLIGKTVVVKYDYDLIVSFSATIDSADYHFSFVGSAGGEVQLFSRLIVNQILSESDTDVKIKIIPGTIAPTTSVQVFLDTGAGYVSQGEVNISTIVGKCWLKCAILVWSNAGTNSARLKLKDLWIDNFKASEVVTNNLTIPASTIFYADAKEYLYSDTDLSSSSYSLDNGGAYTSFTNRTINTIASSTTLKFKWVFSYNNADVQAETETILTAYGALYD